MSGLTRRIAINVGGDYVAGIEAVITGVVMAASRLGWEVVGIRDGFDGLLFPDRYRDGGVFTITSEGLPNGPGGGGAILGNATRSNPFRVRTVDEDNIVQEIDRSADVIAAVRAHGIDAVISIVDTRALSVLFRLSRQGLVSVCVPKSVENDVAGTALSFGFNTALNTVVDTLERVRTAAESTGRLGVVEVLGEHTGWLALQAGMAVAADAVLIPEIAYELKPVAAKLRAQFEAGREYGLVVVAEGAQPASSSGPPAPADAEPSLRRSLSPAASGESSSHVITRSGHAAQAVALELQRRTLHSTYPLVLGDLARGGVPTATDRQLGLGYGAGAVRAVRDGQGGVMVVFDPPELEPIPLAQAINKIRTVPPDSVFVKLARTLGISLGDEVTP